MPQSLVSGELSATSMPLPMAPLHWHWAQASRWSLVFSVLTTLPMESNFLQGRKVRVGNRVQCDSFDFWPQMGCFYPLGPEGEGGGFTSVCQTMEFMLVNGKY